MRSHVLAARYSLQMPSKTRLPDTRHSRKRLGGQTPTNVPGIVPQFPFIHQNPKDHPNTPKKTTPTHQKPKTLGQHGPQEVPLHDTRRDIHPGVNTRVSPRNAYSSYAKVPRGRGRPEATTPSLARTTGPTQNTIPAHPIPRLQGRVNLCASGQATHDPSSQRALR